MVASDSLNMVAFIHRQDITIWGGGSSENGKFRYDISTNGGATWNTDIGVLNSTYSQTSRYPNITIRNASGNTNPFNAKFVWVGATQNLSAQWDGQVNGVGNVQTTNNVSSTENYQYSGTNTNLPSGLCEGLPDEFWMAEFGWNDVSSAWNDTLTIFKGTYSTGTSDVTWTKNVSVDCGSYTAANGGDPILIGPNIAFSPDGMTGWCAWLGDRPGGLDTVVNPIMMKTTNGGVTWGTPIEVNLSQVPWIDDSLKSFWTNQGNPISTGKPTCAFDFDITVDSAGAPHFFVCVGSASQVGGGPSAYSIFSALWKGMIDITTTNGGSTWDAKLVAPALTFRGEFGTPDPQTGDLIDMDNQPQVSRTEDGSKVFFTWVDSDTNVVGFGESDNLAPNLRAAACRVSDGYQTCFKLITDGDIIWDGKILFPSAAPTVLSNSGVYKVPLVFAELLTNNQLAPTRFQYLGNNIQFTNNDFVNPSTIDFSWDNNGGCYTGPCTAPNTAFNAAPSGTTVNFTDLSTGTPTSWYWVFGDGNSSTTQNPTHTYTNAGTYTVCLTAINTCDSITNCQTVTTCNSPQATFTKLVSGNTATFTDASTGTPTNWTWTFGDGNQSTQQNPTYTYSQTGTYTVCLTVTNTCGNDSSCQTVVITCPTPNTSWSYTNNGMVFNFTDNSTGSPTSWLWDFGNGNQSTSQNPVITFTTGGTYNVCLTTTNSCGSDSSCQSVTVVCPTPGVSWSYTQGSGFTFTFTDGSTNTPTSWLWDFGNGNQSTNQNPTHTYASAGTYTVCLTATNQCGSDTSCQTLNVCTPPTAGFTNQISGMTVTFTNTSTNGTSYFWDFGNGNQSTNMSPSHTYQTQGVYTVCMTAINSCDSVTFCDTISLITAIGDPWAATVKLFPNPTSGILNLEAEFAQGGDYEIHIVDILGQIVYHQSVKSSSGTVHRTIDVTNLSSGVYDVMISDGDRVVQRKFTRE